MRNVIEELLAVNEEKLLTEYQTTLEHLIIWWCPEGDGTAKMPEYIRECGIIFIYS